MKNPKIKASTKRKIDSSVERLLADIKGAEPPLDLHEVRRKLELDLHYYSGKDPSHLTQLTHTIKVAGEEKIRSSKPLRWIIKKLQLKAFLFWDLGEIHIDEDLHPIKLRWTEGHEVGHRLCDWHKHYLLGDRKSELTPSCHAKIEAEANYASGQLLFLRNRFTDDLMSQKLAFGRLNDLSKTFKNSKTTTLWRMVEEYRGPEAVVGIVSGHPHHPKDDFDVLNPCQHVIESPEFASKFSNTTEMVLFAKMKEYCDWRRGGPIGQSEAEVVDNNGDSHSFVFESFCYRPRDPSLPGNPQVNQVLTLGIEQPKIATNFTAGQVAAVQNSVSTTQG